MKNCVMSYDAIVGARYYGVGNEYQGVIIGSAIFGLICVIKPNIALPIITPRNPPTYTII